MRHNRWSIVILSFRVAAIPLLLAGIAFMERTRPFSSFRLFTFILLLLLLVDVALFLGRTVRDILIAVISLVFGLTLVEAAVDVFAPQSVLLMPHDFVARVPVMGWGPRHAGLFHVKRIDGETGKSIYDVIYTIDLNLLRETRSCADCATIAFFGDSFTFGEGLNDPDTLAQAFADAIDRKMRVLNLGFSGYSPQQFLRELETGRFDKVIGPQPKLFVFLTAPWHAPRAVCKTSFTLYAPRYALENGKFIYKGSCNEGLALRMREWMENTGSYRFFIEPYLERITHANIDFYIRMLVAATHLAQEKYGVSVLIPYIRDANYLRPTGFTDDEIMKQLQDGGAIVVDASLAQQAAAGARIIIPGETHPSALANRLRAALLKAYIEKHLPTVLAASTTSVFVPRTLGALRAFAQSGNTSALSIERFGGG